LKAKTASILTGQRTINERGLSMANKDFHKEMEKLMTQLQSSWQKISKNAGELAKKGEQELVRASKIGKLQVEVVALNLEKEKIYYEMGKKVAKDSGADVAASVKPFLDKLNKIDSDIKGKNKKISLIKKGKE
jgi:hypothetical protein